MASEFAPLPKHGTETALQGKAQYLLPRKEGREGGKMGGRKKKRKEKRREEKGKEKKKKWNSSLEDALINNAS